MRIQYQSSTIQQKLVNIEENADKIPVPYVLPPGIEQEVDNTTTCVRLFPKQRSLRL